MKKFIYRTIIFIAIPLLPAFIIDGIISGSLRKYNEFFLVNWNDIYSGKLQYDMLIMGSSRALFQYSPAILDSMLGVDSYNLGSDGRKIDTQILKYDTYRRFNRKPSYIIQNVDIWTIGHSSGYCREQFFPYFFDDTLREKSSEIEHWSWAEKYIPSFRYIGYGKLVLQSLINKQSVSYVLTKGYYGNPDTLWDGSRIIPKTEIQYNWDIRALSLFDSYLSKAKSENIKVIFVFAPFHILAMSKVKNVEEMFMKYDSIAKKYDIPVLNYTYDALSYDTAYFYNASHLNKRGSEIFTTKLARDIDSLGLLKY
ncbi:MAG: hypothetical protein LBG92_04790 [Prevotellaceae bacterium]|jgi:hypothetical protein|nr:hypothetical protein [Prevotellaceae bacterium]